MSFKDPDERRAYWRAWRKKKGRTDAVRAAERDQYARRRAADPQGEAVKAARKLGGWRCRNALRGMYPAFGGVTREMRRQFDVESASHDHATWLDSLDEVSATAEM